MPWERPSERTAELIRTGIERLVERPEEGMFAAVDAASLPEHSPEVGEDPTLFAAFRRTNRAMIMHWAEANLRDPGAEVSPFSGQEAEVLVNDLVRRGLDADALEPFRAGQNAAWQAWMKVAFSLTGDAEELRELLEVTARSIFAYVEVTMRATVELVNRERERLAGATSAERLETLTLVLDEAPIDLDRVARRLGYSFERTHLAAIVWSEGDGGGVAELERVAGALARGAGAERALTAPATSAALWVWVATGGDPDTTELEGLLAELGHVRVALGSVGEGIEGFRSSHADAFAAQRLMARLGSQPHLVRYADVKVVALLTQDESRALAFVTETLGELERGPAVLRETLRTYLRAQSNATRAAEQLYAHRNTVVARLAKAEELLPRPLASSALDVAVALEVMHWRGGEG